MKTSKEAGVAGAQLVLKGVDMGESEAGRKR